MGAYKHPFLANADGFKLRRSDRVHHRRRNRVDACGYDGQISDLRNAPEMVALDDLNEQCAENAEVLELESL